MMCFGLNTILPKVKQMISINNFIIYKLQSKLKTKFIHIENVQQNSLFLTKTIN
jgi:hypothetical protein